MQPILQGSLRAIKTTPSALKASAAAVGSAVQHGAAAAGTRARSGAQGIAGAAAVSAAWVQHNLTVRHDPRNVMLLVVWFVSRIESQPLSRLGSQICGM